MKYKSKMYAEALANLILEKKIKEKKIIVNFLKLLKKNQNFKKANEIVSSAEKLLLQKSGNKKIVLETARKIDTKNFIKSFAKGGDVLEEKINPELIAGIKIIINDEKQLDNSLLVKLNKLNVSRNFR